MDQIQYHADRDRRYGHSGPGPLGSLQHIGALTAPILDRLADCELQHGHTRRAEQLADLAASLREVA